MAKIRIIAGDQLGAEFPITEAPLTIGRKSGNTLVIDHAKVSREHARIAIEDGTAVVTDLGSSNGTRVNNEPLTGARPLKDADEIVLGDTTLRFLAEERETPKPFIPGYSVDEPLATGGMGTVYRAVQKSMDREVAIKVLHRQYAAREDFVGRFVQEARSAGKLSHPNIIGVHDVGKAGETYFFAMELVHGSDLSDIIQSRAVEYPEICRIAARVADALDYAHQRGIVHRDIKPDNIMVMSTGQVKLADLGIAKVFEADDSVGTDGKKKVLGTPYYMSPEQARGEAVDGRSDLYSLGCTIYHVLAGVPPFDADSNRDIMLKHLTETPVPLTDFIPNLPGEVSELVERLMAKDVAARVQTAAEARGLLEAAADAKPRMAPAVASGRARPVRMRTPRAQTATNRRVGGSTKQTGRHNPVMQLAAFGILVLVGLALLYLVTRGDSTPPGAMAGGFAQRYADVERLEAASHWEAARKGYRNLRGAYADNPDAIAKIDGRLAFVEAKLKAAEDRPPVDTTPARDERAEKAWREYLAWEKTGGSPADAAERLETLKSVYPALAERIATKLEEHRTAATASERGVAEAFATLTREAADLKESGAYGAVIARLDAFIDEHPSAPEADKATELIHTLRNDAEKLFGVAKTEADGFLRKREYARAIGRLELFKKQIVYPELTERVDDEIAKATSSLDKRAVEVAETVKTLIRRTAFSEATTALISAKGEFGGTRQAQMMDNRIKAIEILKATFEALTARIKAEAPNGRRTDIPFRANALKEAVRIMDVTERGIRLEAGKMSMLQEWAEITPDQMMQLFALYFPPDDPARAGMSLYAKVFGLAE